MLTLDAVVGIVDPQIGYGVLLINPGRGKNAHQQLNQQFIQYLENHALFLRRYVIANNNRKENRVQLAKASWNILMGWVHKHQEFAILEFNHAASRFIILYKWTLSQPRQEENTISQPDLGKIVHKFISNQSQLFCSKAMKHTSTYTLGRGSWKYTADFKIRPLTVTDVGALAKLRKGKFSTEKLLNRQHENGAPGLKTCSPVK